MPSAEPRGIVAAVSAHHRSLGWRRHRIFRSFGAAGLAVGLVAALVAGTAAVAIAGQPAVSDRPAGSTRTLQYAIGVPVCAPAKSGYATCFAERRVLVKKGTLGAEAFVSGDGLSTGLVRSGPRTTIGPAGGLTPGDLATAYGFNPKATGSNQTVAVVEAFNDPTIDADLQTFDSEYGLSACSESDGCLKVVNQKGQTTGLPPDDKTGWSVEESLDVETVHSVCESCKILVVEATSDSNANLGAAVDWAATAGKATEISNSYGGPETTQAESDYNHPGVVITAASGDDGYDAFDQLGGAGKVDAPNTPAAFPTVVAVGGTSLYLSQSGLRQSETVWNDNGVKGAFELAIGQPLGAGGGGCSRRFTAESWQLKVADWSSTGCGTHRLVADVAADADPLTGFDIYHSYACGTSCSPTGWETVGGTSVASPIIAALFALAGGAHGVRYPAATLYSHLGDHSDLYNVTAGGNGFCDGEGAAACGDWNLEGAGVLDCDYTATGTLAVGDRACDALPGYNGPTGVGAPRGLGAFKL